MIRTGLGGAPGLPADSPHRGRGRGESQERGHHRQRHQRHQERQAGHQRLRPGHLQVGQRDQGQPGQGVQTAQERPQEQEDEGRHHQADHRQHQAGLQGDKPRR